MHDKTKSRRGAVIAMLLSLSFSQFGSTQDVPAAPVSGVDYFTGPIIYANDMDRSIRFYTDVLGLKTAGKVEKNGKLVEILLSKSGKLFDGAVLTLQPSDGLPERSDPARVKFGVLIFMTTSNASIGERLKAAGYTATSRDKDHLTTADPDGHRIMIYQFDERLRAAKG